MPVDNGELLQGQRYDESTDLVVPYTQQMHFDGNAVPKVGQPRTDITPNDAHSSLVRVWGQPTIPNTVYLAYHTTVNLNLPDVLKSVTITYNKSSGEGLSKREIGGVQWIGTHGGMSLNPTASGSGSASIIPDVQVERSQTWAQNIPAVSYLFYISGNIVNASDIITRLREILTVPVTSVVAGVATVPSGHHLSANQMFTFPTVVGGTGGINANQTYFVKTVSSSTVFSYSIGSGGAVAATHNATSATMSPSVLTWPIFKPVSRTITLKGEQGSLQISTQAELQYQWSPTNDNVSIMPMSPSEAYSKSKEIGNSVRTVQIPPTIHQSLTFTGLLADTMTADVSATAKIPAITGSGGAPSFAANTNTKSDTLTVSASVFPTGFSATPGQSSIPTSGLYILDSQAEPYKYGLNRVRVTVVDFSAFA